MNASTKFDVWLVRLSYIAQVGLFIITIFTIFYTVIPLYQNASLQESIAKKEKQLKLLKKQAFEYYSDRRTMGLNDYIRSIGLQCTSLLEPILVPLPPGIDEKFIYIPNKINRNLKDCMMDEIKLSKITDRLNKEDKELFFIDVNNVIKESMVIQSVFLKKYNEYVEKSKDYDSALPADSTGITFELYKSKIGSDATGKYFSELREYLRQKGAQNIEFEYESNIRKEFDVLRKIQWTKEIKGNDHLEDDSE